MFSVLTVLFAAYASFSAVKLAASVVVAGRVAALKFKAGQAAHNLRLGLTEDADLQPVIIPPDMVPGFPEMSGEWLLTEAEVERLDAALTRLLSGVPIQQLEDLRILQRLRYERSQDEALRLLAAPKFEALRAK